MAQQKYYWYIIINYAVSSLAYWFYLTRYACLEWGCSLDLLWVSIMDVLILCLSFRLFVCLVLKQSGLDVIPVISK